MNVELNFEKRYRLLREVIETIVLTGLMFMIINLAVQNFDIIGHSMEPTLHDQERVMIDKWTYLFRDPARGDVIVFKAPPQPDQDYVKRIVGLPGDIVTVNQGVPTVNGVQLREFYVAPANMGPTLQDRVIQNVRVPANEYFVMGDNRMGSFDSRGWGFLPRENIHGRLVLIYWPLGQDNNGLLRDVTPVFAQVPATTSSIQPGYNSTSSTWNVDALALNSLMLFIIRPRRRSAPACRHAWENFAERAKHTGILK